MVTRTPLIILLQACAAAIDRAGDPLSAEDLWGAARGGNAQEAIQARLKGAEHLLELLSDDDWIEINKRFRRYAVTASNPLNLRSPNGLALLVAWLAQALETI